MVTQGANVRKGVLVVSSLILTVQVTTMILSLVFYLYASTEAYRDQLARAVFTTLYERTQWGWLRRSRALEFHILISCALQLLFLIPTVLLVIGASRRVRFLLLPFLILYGLLQLALLAAVVVAVFQLPAEIKLLSAAVVAVEAFVVFPWWFAVIHLFAVFAHQEDGAEKAAMAAAAVAAVAAEASAAQSWRFGNGGGGGRGHSYSIGRSSSATKMSDI